MPAVGLPKPPVPQTVTPRSAAAFMSMELLRAPVVISSFRSGRPSITLRGERGALAHHADDGKALQRLDDVVCHRPAAALKTLISTSLATVDQSATFNATF